MAGKLFGLIMWFGCLIAMVEVFLQVRLRSLASFSRFRVKDLGIHYLWGKILSFVWIDQLQIGFHWGINKNNLQIFKVWRFLQILILFIAFALIVSKDNYSVTDVFEVFSKLFVLLLGQKRLNKRFANV